jgi:predicted metal-dependent hydrolase
MLFDFLFSGKKMKAQTFDTQIEVEGQMLPVEVHIEKRNGARFSLTHKGIYMRMPLGISEENLKKEEVRLIAWLTELKKKKPLVFEPFKQKTYKSGDILTVGKRQYLLTLRPKPRKTLAAKRSGYTINIEVPDNIPSDSQQLSDAIKNLLSKIIAGDFHFEILHRVNDLNKLYFNKDIEGLQLKYQSSRWGSCSSAKNITLSTRLLFAPDDVIDYVIIHELAHLVEMNHSDRFWALVERAMPDYEKKEKWLKMNGNLCDF